MLRQLFVEFMFQAAIGSTPFCQCAPQPRILFDLLLLDGLCIGPRHESLPSATVCLTTRVDILCPDRRILPTACMAQSHVTVHCQSQPFRGHTFKERLFVANLGLPYDVMLRGPCWVQQRQYYKTWLQSLRCSSARLQRLHFYGALLSPCCR
jgi:hypothetical protein